VLIFQTGSQKTDTSCTVTYDSSPVEVGNSKETYYHLSEFLPDFYQKISLRKVELPQSDFHLLVVTEPYGPAMLVYLKNIAAVGIFTALLSRKKKE
jgi:hypothetical protein